MTKTPKLTFRKQPRETGLASVGHPHPSVDIKLNGKVVGTIAAANWRQIGWRVWFFVKKPPTTEDPAAFKSTRVHKNPFPDEATARNWVTKHTAAIIALGLHEFEE